MWYQRPLFVFLLASSTSCTSWRAEQLSPGTTLAPRSDSVVRVTIPDGTRLLLRHARLVRDTLRGEHNGVPWSSAVSGMSRVESRHYDEFKTELLLIGLVLVVVVASFDLNIRVPCCS